ncbi:MAG: hypothetical protein ACYCR5_04485 [Leptospirillum sp.]
MIRNLRNLLPGEALPHWTDLVFRKVDPDWVWVCEEDGRIVVVLVAAPVHDLVILCRVQASAPEDKLWWKHIMRKVAADCLDRGFSRYLCSTVPDDRASRGLNAFFRRHGASEGKEGICFIGEWEKIA